MTLESLRGRAHDGLRKKHSHSHNLEQLLPPGQIQLKLMIEPKGVIPMVIRVGLSCGKERYSPAVQPYRHVFQLTTPTSAFD